VQHDKSKVRKAPSNFGERDQSPVTVAPEFSFSGKYDFTYDSVGISLKNTYDLTVIWRLCRPFHRSD
jgi:hypothetical protein